MSRVYTVVRCPRCGKPVPWIESQKFKPFCSDRCRLIDLGAWANEDYFIPGALADQTSPAAHEAEEAELPPH